jgi:CubicO group peptidase (beta-lactamase class C family)
MKKLFLIAASFFWLQIMVMAQQKEASFDALMEETFNADAPGAVALIMKDDKVIYRKAFGMANLELGVKMTPEHIFRIGSITKQFTASAILKLRDEGKLSLDDAITQYVKDYPTQGNDITIKHLLTHTSGITSYTNMQEWDEEVRKKDFTPEGLIDFFKNQPMEFKAGEAWNYNNSGYILLGYIIEQVSGMSYADYISSQFFAPLGMANSRYGSTTDIVKNRAYGYSQGEDGQYVNAAYLSMTQPYAAGSLLSTVDDLQKWYKAVMENKAISKASKEEAHSTYVLKNGKKTGYGYGWGIGNVQGRLSISHDGGINGFMTSSIYLPEEKVFVAVFSNCECTPPTEIATKMAAVAIDKPYEWKKMTMSENDLKSYEAVYENAEGVQRIITFKEGQLYSMRSGGGKLAIHPYEKDKFFFNPGGPGSTTTLHFVRGAKNKIVSVISKSTEYDIEWRRTDKALPVVKGIQLPEAVTDKYVGKYELAPDFVIAVFKEGGKVYAQVSGQPRIEIIPFEENKFSLSEVDAKLTFNKDTAGTITGLTLHQGGNHEAKKVE